MKIQNNNQTINLIVDESCIDIYVDETFVGDFTLENNCGIVTIRPNSIDFSIGNNERKGHYTCIIDAILGGELNNEIDNLFDDVTQINFESVLRTEAACNFWNKRGYYCEYDEYEHENGEQEVIEIPIEFKKS